MSDDQTKDWPSIGDKVEVELNDGSILVGRVAKFSETKEGIDLDGKRQQVYYGWSIIGKIKNTDTSESDWEVRAGQFRKINKVNS